MAPGEPRFLAHGQLTFTPHESFELLPSLLEVGTVVLLLSAARSQLKYYQMMLYNVYLTNRVAPAALMQFQ